MINRKSIAVLPFNNTSGDIENQYFADGIAEEIIITLSKISGLKVTSRTSSFTYRDRQIDVRHIGNELGVSTILEGSVRKAANRVRIATQLVRTDTGFQIWSERFDRELIDIFDLQDEISRLIADKIREHFGHFDIQDDFNTPKTIKAEAYQAYLKGRYYQLQWTNESIQKSQAAYKKSIEIDPKYPMPYLGLSQSFVHHAAWSQVDRMKGLYMAQHFIRQLGNDFDHLAEFHYTKGLYAFIGNWNFQKAQKHLSEALKIKPNYAEALEFQADLCNVVGAFDKSEVFINQALSLNPNALNHHYTKAIGYYFGSKFREAIKALNNALSIMSNWQMALELKALCFLILSDEPAFRSTVALAKESTRTVFYELWHAYHGGESSQLDVANTHDFYMAVPVYLKLYSGFKTESVQKLKEGIEQRAGQFLGFRYDPLLEPLRKESSYKNLEEPFLSISIDKEAPKAVSSIDIEVLNESEVKSFSHLVEQLMKEDKVYIDTQMTLRSLAEKIGLHPNKLSWLINKKIGKGFNEYINDYRLKDFQERAVDPKNCHLTLLGLAYDSGFNSKSVFNDFFKKKTGKTPKAWVRENS
ncbi:helix-turn-helix domain-containing protein [Roseivirga sp.]|uniref:helix-turn-helix domain-containing protein n=1 Tax=Roseivirga sp. TaxID=1964215 RepID=UPI003B8CB3C4